MSYDNFLQREHTRYFNAGPICTHCHCDEEVHVEVEYSDGIKLECQGDCDGCPGYEPHDPRDDEQDDPWED